MNMPLIIRKIAMAYSLFVYLFKDNNELVNQTLYLMKHYGYLCHIKNPNS